VSGTGRNYQWPSEYQFAGVAVMRSSNILKKTRRRKRKLSNGNMYSYRAIATAAYRRAQETAGAASPVKRIDPVAGEVIEILVID